MSNLETIPERDLPLAIPGVADAVRGTQGGKSVRFPVSELPVPSSVDASIKALQADVTADIAQVQKSISINNATMSSRIDGIEQSQGSGMIGYEARVLMDADLAHAPGTLAQVTNDPDPINNGVYRKTGESGIGNWEPAADRTSALQSKVDAAIVTPEVDPQRVPLFVDAGGAVPVWLEDGLLAARGLAPSLLALIGMAGHFAPANQPLDSALPVATDARGLWSWRAKLAMLARGAPTRARLVFTGDSWTEYVPIPAAMVEVLTAAGIGRSGLGWIAISGANMADGVTLARSGFVLYDASSGASPVYGTGIDGQYLSSDTTTATLSIGNCTCTDFRLYYRKHGGAFRWRIDGGEWTSVVADNSGDLGIAHATGLDDVPHLVEIDTSGNTGVVVLCGALASSDGPGFEVLKAGNGNIDGQQYSRFVDSVSPIVEDILPDAVVVILGTNDYTRQSANVERYLQALSGLVDAYRSVAPDCGFIFVAPADSNRSAVRPLTLYRDAAYRFAVEHGHEFYNMHDEWPGYAQANAAGLWLDNAHLNDNGARLLASRLHKVFLEA